MSYTSTITVTLYTVVIQKDFMSGKLDASDHRHDLGSHNEQKIKGQENITQIMWPSLYFQKVERIIYLNLTSDHIYIVYTILDLIPNNILNKS